MKTKNNSTTDKQLLALLRAGLAKENADELLLLFQNPTDWEALYQMAARQTVTGIIFDGLRRLPQQCQPPRPLMLKWCNRVLQLEEDNRRLDEEIANLYDLFRAHGLEPILLKGQAVAQDYPNPLHRQCGDIDLFTGPRDFEWGNKLLRREATDEHEESYKHIGMQWHGVIVENHRVMANLSNPWRDARLQQDIRKLEDPLAAKPTRLVGQGIAFVLPDAFNTAYLLVHALTHFLNEGIGLRHLCDWACHVERHCTPEEKAEAARLLRRYGLQQPARIFGALAVECLGISPECLPIPYTQKDKKNSRFLLNEIRETGNFGRHDRRAGKKPQGRWAGKWYTFTRAVKRCVRVARIAPAEACCYPFALAWHSAWSIGRQSFSATSSAKHSR